MYYVNYCNVDDFEELKKLKIEIKGKIVMCKYGMTFRGNKVFTIYGCAFDFCFKHDCVMNLLNKQKGQKCRELRRERSSAL